MIVTELVLYRLARLFSHTEVAHSTEMKSAMSAERSCELYRESQVQKVLSAAQRFGVSLKGADVLDLGCNDGSLTSQYGATGARHVIGVDVDTAALDRARARTTDPRVEYRQCSTTALPIDSGSMDVVLCYDVFEHVSRPETVLAECFRVLKPGGRMLIGTWGWYHPFAPHLWAAMPVPWAHVFASERTLLRACRRVYHSSWYVPMYHDFDAQGQRHKDRYTEDSISSEYLNKYLVRDFERVFAASGFATRVALEPFGSRYARWTKPLLRVPFAREFVHGYLWAMLQKPGQTARAADGPSAAA